jgi:hypothetical protein
VLALPAGRALAGSLPGTPGRDPQLEADLVPVEQAPFEVDRLPFPNLPAQPPVTSVDQSAARAACAKSGKRLCTELEWERACDSTETFLTALTEWTDSASDTGRVVVRGSGTEPGARCSTRLIVDASSSSEQRGFRCCGGQAQAATYPAPALDAPPVSALELTAEQARNALAALTDHPEVATLAKQFALFEDADVNAALRRGKRSRESITAITILSSSVAWSPTEGEELHVLTGRAGEHAVLVALYPRADGSYTHAASLLLHEPEVSFALGYRETARNELSWTTCYGCPTEGGAIRYAEGRVAIDFR